MAAITRDNARGIQGIALGAVVGESDHGPWCPASLAEQIGEFAPARTFAARRSALYAGIAERHALRQAGFRPRCRRRQWSDIDPAGRVRKIAAATALTARYSAQHAGLPGRHTLRQALRWRGLRRARLHGYRRRGSALRGRWRLAVPRAEHHSGNGQEVRMAASLRKFGMLGVSGTEDRAVIRLRCERHGHCGEAKCDERESGEFLHGRTPHHLNYTAR